MVDALQRIAGMSLAQREELRANARAEIASTRKLDGLVSAMHSLYEDAMLNCQKESL